MKKLKIILPVAAVIIIALAIVLITTASASASLDKAKEVAANYVPKDAKFERVDQDEDEYEIIYTTDTESYEVTIYKSSNKIKKLESRAGNHSGSTKILKTQQEVEAIIKGEHPNAQITLCEVDKDGGYGLYDVVFSADQISGNYKINPETGAIVRREIKYETPIVIPSPSAQSDSAYMSIEAIEKLALEKLPGGKMTGIDLELEKDRYIFNVEVTKDGVEYDFDFDATTGEDLTSHEANQIAPSPSPSPSVSTSPSKEKTSDAKPSASSSPKKQEKSTPSSQSSPKKTSSKSIISAQQAKAIALNKVSGAKITEFEYDRDDRHYEGEMYKGNTEYEFEIDARTGKIIEWKTEHRYRDDDDHHEDDHHDD